MQWNKGDILKGRKGSDAIHPIIFLEGKDDTYFIGAMITSSPNYKDNILMKSDHFETEDLGGERYEVSFEESYLVDAKLLKRMEWLPFSKVGQLTTEGVDFVISTIGDKYPQVWEEYKNQ